MTSSQLHGLGCYTVSVKNRVNLIERRLSSAEPSNFSLDETQYLKFSLENKDHEI